MPSPLEDIIYPKAPPEDPIIMQRPSIQAVTLPPQHRIWQNLIDTIAYIAFLIIALIAAMHHVEATPFWVTFTAIVVGVLTRTRGGKVDSDTVLKLLGR